MSGELTFPFVLDLVRLRSFAEVAERGTVAAAAEALGFTAPAVSQHLAKLERELGVDLFDRAGRRLRLTDAGAALLPVALDMIDLDARARHAVHDTDELPHLVVAGFASALATILVPRLPALTGRLTIDVVEAEDADAMRDLGLGAVDLVLAQEYDGIPEQRNERFDFQPIRHDELRLVVPADMPARTEVADLGDAPWLLNGTGTRCAAATLRILDDHGLRPHIAGSVADNATLLALVAAGHGVTVAPELLLGDLPSGVRLAPQELGVRRTLLAVSRSPAAPAVASLIDVLRG